MKTTTAATHLRLDEYEIDKDDYVVVLDVFVGESFAARALSEA